MIDLMAAQEALRSTFGFADFRPGQRAIVEAVLRGADVLAIMPTGSGKSLCYQLPALLRDDLTVVVSPLVALMQDQMSALERVAPGAAAVINSQQGIQSNAAVLRRVQDREVRVLYVAPERFGSSAFERALHGVV